MTVEITSDWARQHMARGVPGSWWDRDARAWLVDDPPPRTCAILLKLFPELERKYPVLAERRDELAKDVRPFDNSTPHNKPVRAARVRATMSSYGSMQPYKFQELDVGYLVDVMRQHGGAYCMWERGLGKTLATCLSIDELDAQRTLIVCPNTAKHSVWKAELERFCPWLDVLVMPNQKTKRERFLKQLAFRCKNPTKPFVVVTHYESLVIVAGKTKKGNSLRLGTGWQKYGEWDLVVADEAHRLWNTKAQMTRALKVIPTKHKFALSGSVIMNHASELFSVLQWLFPDTYKAKWRDWNDRYIEFIDIGYGKTPVGIKPGMLDAMRHELGVFATYRRKEDELDLPAKTEQTLLVDLSPKQRRAYDDLLADYVTVLDDGTPIKAADGLALLTRLRQVATGLDTLGQDVADSTKLDTAAEMILDNEDEAFVVFSWYKAPCHTLAERLRSKGVECYVIDGDTKHEDRSAAIQEFQAGGGRVFIGTLATLGESVNLHRASNAIFLDRHWNPATNTQAADRIYRIGQTKPVTITHLVSRDTVDELRVLPTLANKEALRRAIFGGQ